MDKFFWPMGIDAYERLIGAEAVERILRKAKRLHGLRVINISSTFHGGGVAEMLSSLTLMQRALGIRADWRLIQGSPDFFSVTKKLHNALQGGDINLTELKRNVYEQVISENALRMDIDADFVVVHDPQPLPLISHYRRTCPWVWRCHVDLTQPDVEAWNYLRGFVEEYDAMISSLPEYTQKIEVPQVFFMPAIDPFSLKNRELSEAEIKDRLEHYGIPDDLPIVVQVSRFDRWKDPEGVIQAFKIARREVPATLVLLGNIATDDPEGQEVFESLLSCKEERIIILTATDSALVNALQRCAAVVMQKSLREGFGLTVTEAMWKGAAVIGGNCGGIRRQIEDGVSGFLVSTVEEAAARLVQLLKDKELRASLGRNACESVRRQFLLTRLAEQYLDLFDAFEPHFTMHARRAAALGQPAE
ncbi:MAG: glycosyltransferase [Gammaproteobacteria bacterium]|nr:glycosyltransferase [Gammaproteobacteria bacterium]